jgi:hypothetical protein
MSLDIKVDDTPQEIDLAASHITSTIEFLTERYRETYDKVKELDSKLSETKKNLEMLGTTLYDKMVEEGVLKLSTEFGSFRAYTEQNCSMKPECKEQIFNMFEELGLGGSIKRDIPWQTLNKHRRNGDFVINEDNTDLFVTWERKRIGIRRS